MKKKVALLVFTFCVMTLQAQKIVEFQLADFPIEMNQVVGIRGNTAPLSWEKSIAMTKSDSSWVLSISFPADVEALEFKFVRYTEDTNVDWETIENRTLRFEKAGKTLSVNTWDTESVIDISTLPLLDPKDLQEDFELIKTMVLEVHPGTFRYNDLPGIQDALKDLEEQFQQPTSYQDAYLAISKLLAQIQCDHTFASFYNQGGIIKSVIHKQKNKLPFAFKWIDDRMIVTYDATLSTQLKAGTEIVSINNIPAKDILTALMPYVAADGATNKSRIGKLEVDGYDFRYNDFDVFFPLVFDLPSDNLLLEIQLEEEATTTFIEAETQTIGERFKVLTERYAEFPKSHNDLLNFEIVNANTAVLTLNSFGLTGWKSLSIDYKAFYAEAFASFREKNMDHLIIDIRQNNGGNDEMLEELCTYFDLQRIIKDDSEGRTRYTVFPNNLKNSISSWGEPWYYDLSKQNPVAKDGYFLFPDAYRLNVKNTKKKNYFKGKLYLLTSPANASLAYYFAKSFKDDQLGLIIGEETGGNLRGINGGQILFLKLPNSGIEIDFPVMGEFSTSELPNKGVTPDYIVPSTQKDLSLNIDQVMEYTQKLILQQ